MWSELTASNSAVAGGQRRAPEPSAATRLDRRLVDHRWHVVRLVLGAILVAAALLKWQSFGRAGFSPLAEVAPQLELLLIQIELVVGLWLLSGWAPGSSRWAAVALFSAFVGAGIAMAVQGRSHCGCLGVVDVNPLWLIALDAAAMGGLVWAWKQGDRGPSARPRATMLGVSSACPYRPFRPLVHSFRQRATILLVSIAALALGLAVVFWVPQVSNAMTRMVPPSLTGQRIVPRQAVIDAGTGTPGQWVRIEVVLENRSRIPVRIIGGQQTCQCRTASGLPITIEPGAAVSIPVEVHLGRTRGRQQASFWLMTDHPGRQYVVCRWRADVAPPSPDDYMHRRDTDDLKR